MECGMSNNIAPGNEYPKALFPENPGLGSWPGTAPRKDIESRTCPGEALRRRIRSGMKKLAFLIAGLIVGIASCTNVRNRPSSPKEYKTRTNKTILISETHPMGQSLSTIKISTKDFEHNFTETFENVDPISKVFIADLDANGFDEIYIITTSVGSGSYGKVLGLASNNDKSLSLIHFPDTQREDDMFTGYMGHDVFTVEGQKLVRTFPLYKEGDTNPRPTGGKRKLIYGLYPGEAMWQLRIEKSEEGGTGPAATGIEGIEWQLVEVNGVAVSPLPGERRPFLRFDEAKKQVTGFAGCNNFFGGYALDGSSLKFGPVGSTRMACPDLQMSLETEFLKALEKTRAWKISEHVLFFLDDGNVLARFAMAQGVEKATDNEPKITGTIWHWGQTLYSDDRKAVPLDPKNYTVQFMEDGTLNVKADCNQKEGTYSASAEDRRLSIEITHSTMAACRGFNGG